MVIGICVLLFISGCMHDSRRETLDYCKKICIDKSENTAVAVTLTSFDTHCLCELQDGSVILGW